MPQGFCKLGSMTLAPWSVRFDTRLVWVNAVLAAPASAPMAERLRSPVARAIARVNGLCRMLASLRPVGGPEEAPLGLVPWDVTPGASISYCFLRRLSAALHRDRRAWEGQDPQEGDVTDEGKALGRATGGWAGGDHHRDRGGRSRAPALGQRCEELRPGFRRQPGRHPAFLLVTKARFR